MPKFKRRYVLAVGEVRRATDTEIGAAMVFTVGGRRWLVPGRVTPGRYKNILERVDKRRRG